MLSRKIILSCLIFLFITSTAFANGPFVKGELLIQQTRKATKANIDQAIEGVRGEVLEELLQIRVKRIRVPEAAMDKVKAALSKNPNFEFVEENFLAQSSSTPNDPSFNSQWHHNVIMAPSGWDISTGSDAIPIAIIDSGIDPDHPDLMAKLISGYNFLNYDTDTHDVLGHGTAVAGSAGAMTNNALGVAGVAWQNPIMPLVVLDSSNWATYTNISNAIIFAVDNGAKIINISIGGSSSSYTLENAVNYAWDNGVLVFASAANYNTSTPYYPAACTHAVAVAATDGADNRASFSNYGNWITVAAPGVSILTTSNGGGYSSWSGTSFSSPITAGVAGLIWSANPELSQQEVLDILINTADDLGPVGFDVSFGHGRINAYNALLAATDFEPEVDYEAPTINLTSPSDYATVSGTATISAIANDNVAIAKVEFSIDGKLIGSDTSSPYSISWNTEDFSADYHTIEVKAIDSSENESEIDSAQVSIEEIVPDIVEEIIEVTDNLPPTVSILSPSNGSDLTDKTTITAAATDENGVVEMKVYVDGVLKVKKTTDSIIWRWNTRKVSSGSYVVKVEATDSAGNIGIDEIVLYK